MSFSRPRPHRRNRPGTHGRARGLEPDLAAAGGELADTTFRLADKDLKGSSPLEAELWTARLVTMWAGQHLVDGSDPVAVLGHIHVDRALAEPSPVARVVIGALASVCPNADVAARAAHAATQLDRQKVRLPTWAAGVGDQRFRRAALMDHELDDGQTVLLGFAYPGGEQYTANVYVDTNLGVLVKDVFIGASIATVEATVRTEMAAAGGTLRELDPAEARARIEEGFRRLDDALEEDPELPISEDVADLRVLIEAHVRRLPPGGTAPPRRSLDDPDADEVIEATTEAFLASEEGRHLVEVLDEDTVAHIGEHLAEHAVRNGGDPERISPVSVEVFLFSSLPDSGCFGPEDVPAIIDVTTGWARWALTRRGLDRWIDETVGSAHRHAFGLEQVLATVDDDVDAMAGPLGGGAGEVLALLAADGVDPDDEAAVLEWLERYADDVASGRRPPPSGLDLSRVGPPVGPPRLDERAPDRPDDERAAVADLVAAAVAELELPPAAAPRMEAIAQEAFRVCRAVLDEEFFLQAMHVLSGLVEHPEAGLARGRPEIWAGGILYALGQDVDLFEPDSVPHVPAAQLARIVGASQSSLITRANQIRGLLDDEG